MKHIITADKITKEFEHLLASHVGPEEDKALVAMGNTYYNKLWYRVVRKGSESTSHSSLDEAIAEYNK